MKIFYSTIFLTPVKFISEIKTLLLQNNFSKHTLIFQHFRPLLSNTYHTRTFISTSPHHYRNPAARRQTVKTLLLPADWFSYSLPSLFKILWGLHLYFHSQPPHVLSPLVHWQVITADYLFSPLLLHDYLVFCYSYYLHSNL